LSEPTAERIKNLVTRFSNLEYDLAEGKRGSRYTHFEKLLTKITGAEAAMAVNNNAAAVLLILSTFAKDKEVVVSRGELVEIGDSFRIPEVMEQSGGKLREVGTTNKTHLYDYEKAISDETAALMKINTSNYSIVGFTKSVSLSELADLGRKHGILVIEDLGSGALVDLSDYGLSYERTVQSSIASGADIVCFSGDKLLGGPQAGLIVGKKSMVDQIKRHPLTRALRIDKITAIALESVLHEYLVGENLVNSMPVLKFINMSQDEINEKAEFLYKKVKARIEKFCEISIMDCESQIGGGTLPMERLKSKCIVLRPKSIKVISLERELRSCDIPIIGRISNEQLLLDVRTVFYDELETIAESLIDVLSVRR
jgi:L-seryl-tRNA(Ser) seleniumtransferase